MTDQLFLEPETMPHTADRSTLERACECPRQSRFIELGRVLSTRACMESGSQCHKAIGETIDEYVNSQGQMGVSELSDFLQQRAAASRPDLQPDVLKALRFSAWNIAKYLNGIHYLNVLRWDGGRDDHSGQMSYDLADMGVRFTSEVDLIHATDCPEVLAEVDFKTGNDKWLPSRVGEAFQFQCHAVLIFKNYPKVNAVECSIWNTRSGQRTYPTLFERKRLFDYEYRIRNAAMAWLKTQDKEPEACEPWPTVEKCETCPAAFLCDCITMPADTPEQLVDKLVGLEARTNGIRKVLASVVGTAGKDVVTASGNCYGFGKPKQERKPTAKLYSVKVKEETETEEPGE